MNDLIVRHLAGVIPGAGGTLTVDPLPFGVSARLQRLTVAGRKLDVRVTPTGFSVRIDGKDAGKGRIGIPLEIAW